MSCNNATHTVKGLAMSSGATGLLTVLNRYESHDVLNNIQDIRSFDVSDRQPLLIARKIYEINKNILMRIPFTSQSEGMEFIESQFSVFRKQDTDIIAIKENFIQQLNDESYVCTDEITQTMAMARFGKSLFEVTNNKNKLFIDQLLDDGHKISLDSIKPSHQDSKNIMRIKSRALTKTLRSFAKNDEKIAVQAVIDLCETFKDDEHEIVFIAVSDGIISDLNYENKLKMLQTFPDIATKNPFRNTFFNLSDIRKLPISKQEQNTFFVNQFYERKEFCVPSNIPSKGELDNENTLIFIRNYTRQNIMDRNDFEKIGFDTPYESVILHPYLRSMILSNINQPSSIVDLIENEKIDNLIDTNDFAHQMIVKGGTGLYKELKEKDTENCKKFLSKKDTNGISVDTLHLALEKRSNLLNELNKLSSITKEYEADEYYF